jgi:hypothetical protein
MVVSATSLEIVSSPGSRRRAASSGVTYSANSRAESVAHRGSNASSSMGIPSRRLMISSEYRFGEFRDQIGAAAVGESIDQLVDDRLDHRRRNQGAVRAMLGARHAENGSAEDRLGSHLYTGAAGIAASSRNAARTSSSVNSSTADAQPGQRRVQVRLIVEGEVEVCT